MQHPTSGLSSYLDADTKERESKKFEILVLHRYIDLFVTFYGDSTEAGPTTQNEEQEAYA